MRIRNIGSFCIMAVLAVPLTATVAQERPFMIVQANEYAALQARSSRWPWSVMKSKSLSDARSLADIPNADITSRCERIHAMAAACGLAYILDPDGRSLYVDRFESAVACGLHALRLLKGSRTEHEYNVPPAHAAFMVYLALDILYHDLDPAKRLEIEADCDAIADGHGLS